MVQHNCLRTSVRIVRNPQSVGEDMSVAKLLSPAVVVGMLLLFSRHVLAQQTPAAASQPAFGQVTGQVFCQDSGLPARFAAIRLVPEKPQQSPVIASAAELQKNVDLPKLMAKVMAEAMKGSSLATVTGMDGSFVLDKIPPGTYYLVANLPGYLSPLSGLSEAERMKADAEAVAAVQSVAQKVVVAGGASTSVNLSLERGATLSGKVTYDDGSPAPAVTPTLLLQKDGKWKQLSPLSTFPAATDDRGQFRFFGLPAGKYAVKATLPVTQPVAGLGAVSAHIDLEDALVVYHGGALREKDIKPIEVGDGDHRDGIEVVFPINGLHSISGSVVAKFDKHPVNSGTVELQDPDTKADMRTARVGEDGTFKLSNVPEGGYLLKVTAAADTEQKAGGAPAPLELARMLNVKIIKSYGAVDMPLQLTGDLNGIVLQVPDEKQPSTPAP